MKSETASAWQASPRHHLALILFAVIAAELVFRINPTSYYGGATDDQRYLEAALAWMIDGPHAGENHWALRHPLVLALAASLRSFGLSVESLLLVPRFAAVVMVAVTTPMIARVGGLPAALLWLAMILLSPVIHEMATSCYPEILEFAFVAVSLWSFHEARKRPGLYLLSGVTLGLAVLTRETALFLLPLYIFALVRRRQMVVGALWGAAGFVPPVLVDTVFLWSQTGDFLYRLHVDTSHVGIASGHLEGGVYHGRPFLNPELASRWVPSGPVQLHWAINPILNMLFDPAFGGIFIAWGILEVAEARATLARNEPYHRLRPALIAIAIAGWVMVTWVLTLRPQPRYYLIAVYVATIAVALLAAPSLARRSRVALAVTGMLMLGGLVMLAINIDRSRDAKLILPWLAAHPGQIVHLRGDMAKQLAFPLALERRVHQVRASPPPIGALRIRVVTSNPPQDRLDYEPVAIIAGPRKLGLVGPRRQMAVERRVR